MLPLNNYIDKSTKNIYDAHIHLFNYNSVITNYVTLPKQYKKFIGFIDYEFQFIDKYKDYKIEEYYDNFINNYYDSDKMILLATGIDPEKIINIYLKYPVIIKGFGELKLYAKYKNYEIPNKELLDYQKLYEFDSKLPNPLPIYIHYSLTKEEKMEKFINLLELYPNIPFVLCHFGIFKRSNDKEQIIEFNRTKSLLYKYNNLYSDISYSAAIFFNKHPEYLKILPTDKLLIGSDLNVYINDYYHGDQNKIQKRINKEYAQIKNLDKYINCNKTVEKLFNLF